jgi:hypothetical protein
VADGRASGDAAGIDIMALAEANGLVSSGLAVRIGRRQSSRRGTRIGRASSMFKAIEPAATSWPVAWPCPEVMLGIDSWTGRSIHRLDRRRIDRMTERGRRSGRTNGPMQIGEDPTPGTPLRAAAASSITTAEGWRFIPSPEIDPDRR